MIDRIDLSTVPSAMETRAAAWCSSPAATPRPTLKTPRALPPRRHTVTSPAYPTKARREEAPLDTVDDKGKPIEARARADAMKAIARDVMDPKVKASMLSPAEAEAMVLAKHDGNRDYYLRHETHSEIKRALFRLGCVGSRGPADKRYWLGPYGSKVRLALLEDETS